MGYIIDHATRDENKYYLNTGRVLVPSLELLLICALGSSQRVDRHRPWAHVRSEIRIKHSTLYHTTHALSLVVLHLGSLYSLHVVREGSEAVRIFSSSFARWRISSYSSGARRSCRAWRRGLCVNWWFRSSLVVVESWYLARNLLIMLGITLGDTLGEIDYVVRLSLPAIFFFYALLSTFTELPFSLTLPEFVSNVQLFLCITAEIWKSFLPCLLNLLAIHFHHPLLSTFQQNKYWSMKWKRPDGSNQTRLGKIFSGSGWAE